MIDTDFVCRTTASFYVITTEQVEKLRAKYEACEKILFKYEWTAANLRPPPALDYILVDPHQRRYFKKNKKSQERVRDYKKEQRINKLTTSFKNIIVFHWLKI